MKNPQCGHEMVKSMNKKIWHCPHGGCAQWMEEYDVEPAHPASLLERLRACLAKIRRAIRMMLRRTESTNGSD